MNEGTHALAERERLEKRGTEWRDRALGTEHALREAIEGFDGSVVDNDGKELVGAALVERLVDVTIDHAGPGV